MSDNTPEWLTISGSYYIENGGLTGSQQSVIETLMSSETSMSITEIANEIDYHRSTVYDAVNDLDDVLEQNGNTVGLKNSKLSQSIQKSVKELECYNGDSDA